MNSYKLPPAQFFMPSSRLRPFRLEQDVDLVASNVPSFGQDAFTIFDFKVPKNQVFIVKSLVFTAARRVNIGNTDEAPELLSNEVVAGQFGYQVLVDGKDPLVTNTNKAKFIALASVGATNNQRNRGGYFTSVSVNPDYDLMSNWWNPLFTFAVRSEHNLQVIFRVLPVGTGATAIEITDDPAVTRRVDFAGALFEGNVMSEVDYTALEKQGAI